MSSIDERSFTPVEVELAGTTAKIIDLPRLTGPSLARLPVVLRVLLENVVRNMQGEARREAADAILAWLKQGSSEAEIEFQPDRVLMHDTTSTPALVDIAAMRDALAEAGLDPTALNPTLPVDVSVDHSLAVEVYGRHDAPQINLQHEIRRNQERYRFLRWAATALRGVHINPPGTGIMHTINLEQLATVAHFRQREGDATRWAVPETMIGTDSHTPMINGIGVLGWGVGGLEAQTVMFGLPTMLRIPDVIGVRLVGALPPGTLATDLALTVTQRLRAIGVAGEFVEFFGPGVSMLSAGDRAVVANMAPEYGATTGLFPVDERTLDYLRETGRSPEAIALVGDYLRRAGLWFDPHNAPRYTRTIEVDLGKIGMHIAGPRRPQDLLPLSAARRVLAELSFIPQTTGQPAAPGPQPAGHPAPANAGTPPKSASGPAHSEGAMPRFPVAIAAITSCTNTTNPALLIAAGLLARKARAAGLRPPSWVKTSLSPGSPAAATYLERAGVRDDLEAVGFAIVGYGCATCIGNPGPMPDVIREAAAAGRVRAVGAISGNRNFPGRVHPDLELGFLMSPPLVVAFALAGDAERDLTTEPVQVDAHGKPVYLRDLWPASEEIAACVAKGTEPTDFGKAFAIASKNPLWDALEAPTSPLYPWDPASTALRRPPFAAASEGSQLGSYVAAPLLVVGDDVTTDHISPASAIPPDSLVADFLVARGDDRSDLNVFASRRGNWEVMLRAAFHNKSLVNLLRPGMPVVHTVHGPSGTVDPIWEVADRYRQEGRPVVLVAGERYGTGSSRDWAAKGQRLLGIRAVLAMSFERIHRSNLIGMGILPLRLPADAHPTALNLTAGDLIEVHAAAEALVPRGAVDVIIRRTDGSVLNLATRAAVETQLEVDLLRNGGVIPTILKSHLSRSAQVHPAS